MDNFYIVLPSNVPTNDDEINKTSCYKTYLPTALNLEQDAWEVALVQMNYPHSWCNISDEIGEITISKDTYEHGTILQRTIFIPAGYYTDVHKLLELIQSMLKSIGMKSTLEQNPKNEIMIKIYPGESIKFHKVLAAMLGFQRKGFLSTHEEVFANIDYDPFLGAPGSIINKRNTKLYHANQKFDLRVSQYNIYVYCDILKLTLVGNTYVPLLHSIAIDGIPGTYIHKEFLSPHYIPLQNGFISNIQIRLCDDLGNNIRFQWGKVIVKLHFRRRLNHS